MSDDLRCALYQAARTGDISSLEQMNITRKFKSDEFQVYYEAAKTGQMLVIDWLRQHGFGYNDNIIYHIITIAGEIGDMDFIIKLHDRDTLTNISYKGCSLYYGAIKTGNMKLLEWLKTNKLPMDISDVWNAVEDDNFWFVHWCDINGYEWKCSEVCNKLTRRGDLENLKWVRSQGCPWGDQMYYLVIQHRHLELLEWIITNECPVPKWLHKHHLRDLLLVKELHPHIIMLMDKLL